MPASSTISAFPNKSVRALWPCNSRSTVMASAKPTLRSSSTALIVAALQLLQRSGFPGACRPANVHRQVMRIENKVDCLFLLGTEELGSSEFILPAQSLKLTNPAIDPLDHVPLTAKTLACGDFLPSPQDFASAFL